MSSPSRDSRRAPGCVAVCGPSGAGKTTLIERLIPQLKARGVRVGAVKHAHDGFALDDPGKDSWRCTQAGAEVVVLVGPSQTAWWFQTADALPCDRAVARIADRVDIVLVEGFKREPYPRIVLEPGTPRLTVDDGCCWVGVAPDALRPGELARLVEFCVRQMRVPGQLLKEGQAMETSLAQTITVTVLCFAQLRDHFGDRELRLAFPVGATGRALLAWLCERRPALAPLLEVSRLAVNRTYASWDQAFSDGDELVVIPPVSGG